MASGTVWSLPPMVSSSGPRSWLAVSTSAGECGEKAADAAVTEQDRYILALMGVAKFLDAIGAKELYGERFGKLAIAISDLESGRVAPVLSPRPFGKGRPPDGSEAWIRRAFVALAVEALLLSGSKRVGAAREIVRSFPAGANLARAKSPVIPTPADCFPSLGLLRNVVLPPTV